MSELINGKDAKLAWANGKKLQIANTIVGEDFYDIDDSNTTLNIFDLDFYKFRLKPRTITLNNIEIPAPFEPKEGDDCRCYHISTALKNWFDWYHSTHYESHKVAWRTEEEIKQVVSALRSIFKGGV